MRKFPGIRNGRRTMIAALTLLFVGCAGLVATPPEYRSIPREQRIAPPIEESESMRIWVVHIGQGDGILIQLPMSHAYERDNGSEEDSMLEFIDIMIDGGASRFRWDHLPNEDAIAAMVEPHHILIETDGHWFRVVKVSDDHADPRNPPTVTETKRGYGTRWVRAREN